MCDSGHGARRSIAARLLNSLRAWWRQQSDDPYLATAADNAELERRIRAIERDPGPAVPITFNH